VSLQTRLEALVAAIGADIKAARIEPYAFSYNGAVTAKVGTSKLVMATAGVIESVSVHANTAPTVATLIVDVNRNDVTIYGTQGNRPTVAIGAKTATGGAASNGTFAAGDVLSVDVDQPGTNTADVTVLVRYRRTV
jgi:hypothetical protein